MRILLLLLLFPTFLFSQTSIKEENIYAAAGNQFEWLMTNVDTFNKGGYGYEGLLTRMGFYFDDEYKDIYNDKFWQRKYSEKIVSGNEKRATIYFKESYKKVSGCKYPIITKMEIWGDTESVVTFYVNFWSRALNFRDTKPGETVTTRFLSDVASLSVGTNGQSKIVVTTAKDYYK
jgi:hypothetical protein